MAAETADVKRLQSSTPYRVTLAGLLIGAIGILILWVSGADMPAVPPGIILLLAAAALLAFGPWKWTPIVAIVIGLSEAAGTFATSSNLLFDTDPFSWFAGTWVRVIGIVLILVGGVMATRLAFRK
jgi:hypothetical protein